MGNLSRWMADLFNGFHPNDLPLVFVQLLVPVLLAWLIALTSGHKHVNREFYFIPFVVALGTLLSKQSVPLSVSAGVIMVLMFSRIKTITEDKGTSLPFIFALMAGWSCGAGFVAVTLICYLVVVIPVVYLGRKK